MKIVRIGIDTAKQVFQLHGVDARGQVLLQKQLSRGRVLEYFAKIEACLIGMEDCAGSHYCARE